jgi:hypothetical protein
MNTVIGSSRRFVRASRRAALCAKKEVARMSYGKRRQRCHRSLRRLPAIMPVADVKTVVTNPEGVKPVTLRIVCT